MTSVHRAALTALLIVTAALAAVAPASAQTPVPLPPVLQPEEDEPQQDEERPPPEEAPPPPAPGPVSTAPGSVAEAVDVAHTGHLPDDELVPPLVPRWTVAGGVEYVRAGGGRIYVVQPGAVVALDPATGRPLWTSVIARRASGAAFDDGVLFLTLSEEIVALDAATGAERWRHRIPQSLTLGAPVASGGAVYVADSRGDDMLRAYRTSDGGELWSKPIPDGVDAPALDNDRAYVGGSCDDWVALARRDGAEAWRRSGDCYGLGRATPALFAGRLYPDHGGGAMIDAAAGGVLAKVPGGRPIFVDGLAVNAHGVASGEVGQTTLVATDLASGRPAWGVEKGLSRPIAVGHDVYGVRENEVFAVGGDTGHVLWSAKLSKYRGGVNEVTEVAAAPGLLLVGNGEKLVAYQSYFQPPPTGVAAGVSRTDVPAGRTFNLIGVAGRELRRPDATVRVDSAPWRRGKLRRLGDARLARDGGFAEPITLFRNSRFRVAAGDGASRVFTVYAHLRARFGKARRAAGGRIGVPVSLRTPRTKLAGRTMVLYLYRARAKRYDRLGAVRLRGAGTGRSRGTVTFRPLRRVGEKDGVAVCVRGQLRLGLGRPSALTRRCGAARLR